MKARRQLAQLAVLDRERRPVDGSRVGWVAGHDDRGVVVDFEGNARGPLPARSTIALDPAAAEVAARARTPAVLVFENGDPALPILVGLLQPTADRRLLEEVLDASASPPKTEARVDGRRVIIEGQDEVVLRCGEATITLQRNGKVTIRGARITSTAKGTHRIRGGSVQIN